MKFRSYRFWLGCAGAMSLVLLNSGCQQASNPTTAALSQPSDTAAAGVSSGSTTVNSSSLLNGLLGPSVSCVQTCSSPSASVGASVTYSVNVNVSGGTANACQITDVLPAGMSYVQGTATTLAGGTFTCTGSTLTWVYNSLGPCNCVMTYVAMVNNTAGLVGSTLANTSSMTCSGLSGAISSTANLLVSAVSTAPTACVCTLVPTFTPVSLPPTNTPTPVPPVPTCTFTPVPPTNTPTFTYTSTSTPTNTFTATSTPTNTFTCTNTFTSTFTSTPTNTFTATKTFTPVPPTNTPTFTFTSTRTSTPVPPPPTSTPIPIPTISLSQVSSQASAALGAAVTYTLNLGVTGCSCSANNVTIQDVLPAGMTYVQGTATAIAGGAFSASGQTLTWVYNSVGPCSCTMTYVAQVDNSLTNLVGSTLSNSAVLTCPSLSSSLTASADVLVTGVLGGVLGL